jgi:hypothetical protein
MHCLWSKRNGLCGDHVHLSVFLWPGLSYLNGLLDFCEIQCRGTLQNQAWVTWEPAGWQSYFTSCHTSIFPLFLTNFGDMQQADLHIMLLSCFVKIYVEWKPYFSYRCKLNFACFLPPPPPFLFTLDNIWYRQCSHKVSGIHEFC